MAAPGAGPARSQRWAAKDGIPGQGLSLRWEPGNFTGARLGATSGKPTCAAVSRQGRIRASPYNGWAQASLGGHNRRGRDVGQPSG